MASDTQRVLLQLLSAREIKFTVTPESLDNHEIGLQLWVDERPGFCLDEEVYVPGNSAHFLLTKRNASSVNEMEWFAIFSFLPH